MTTTSRATGRATTLGLCLAAACGHPTPGRVAPDERSSAEAAARRAVREEQSIDVASIPPRSIGIPPFRLEISDTALAALGYGLADLLTTDLGRSGQLQVVDRIRLGAVLREIRLVETGRVDSTTAPRVGRMVQARRLVLGSLGGPTAGQLAITAHVADVLTGRIQQSVAAQAKLEDILLAEKELAFRLFEQLNVTLSPAERGAVEQMPTRNVTALLAFSRGVRFETEGRWSDAAQEYRRAVGADPGFQAAQAHLESVESSSAPVQLQQASAAQSQAARASDLVTDRVNEDFMSPLGSQEISSPVESGADFPLPASITITLTVPR